MPVSPAYAPRVAARALAFALVVGATAGAALAAGVTETKFGVRLSVQPHAPRVGERATLTLRAFWEDGRPMERRYPFKVLAVGPGVDFFAALGSLTRPTSSLGPRDRFLIPMRRAEPGLWRGRFGVPRRGRWRIVVTNFVGADRRIPAFAEVAFESVAGGR